MLKKITKKLKRHTEKPEKYLTPQNEAAQKLKRIVKKLYDASKTLQVEINSTKALKELITDEMDEEQLWQQLELNNKELIDVCINDSAKFLVEGRLIDLDYKRKVYGNESDGDIPQNSDSEDNNEVEFTPYAKIMNESRDFNLKGSIVDDEFFKLAEMEAFCEQEDRKEMKKTKQSNSEMEDDINYFEDLGEDSEDENNLKYNQYFNQQDPEENYEDEEGFEDAEQENENETRFGRYQENEETELSTFERRQKQLQNTIDNLERQALQDKKWQLKGEINATTRPENALLEEILEFDSATRPAPIITEQTTMQLEDIIKQRVKDRAFDDVERKIKTVQTPQEYRKTLVLDQEKSKESLAQIYEKEYIKSLSKLNQNDDDKTEEEPKEHKEIRKAVNLLLSKLDALSNYHITPKPAVPELKIITNTPAIEMEEVAPMIISNATLLAPEEVKSKAKIHIMTKEEMTKTDKNRLKRQKKIKQKQKRKLMEQKASEQEQSGKSNKLEKQKILNKVMKNSNVERIKETSNTKVNSSKAFFSKLQDENDMKKKKIVKKPKTANSFITAKALKL